MHFPLWAGGQPWAPVRLFPSLRVRPWHEGSVRLRCRTGNTCGPDEVYAGEGCDPGNQGIWSDCLDHWDRHLPSFREPELAKSVLIPVGDGPFVEDLDIGVVLGGVGHGVGGARYRMRAIDEVPDRPGVELCTQQGDAELVEHVAARSLDGTNDVGVRRAIELSRLEREVHDQAPGRRRPGLPPAEEQQLRRILALHLRVQRRKDAPAQKKPREE